MSEVRVFDAIGLRMFVGQEVAYAGSDHKRRPTINSGYVRELKPGKAKVFRLATSSTNNPSTIDDKHRNVWVNVERIIGITMYSGEGK